MKLTIKEVVELHYKYLHLPLIYNRWVNFETYLTWHEKYAQSRCDARVKGRYCNNSKKFGNYCGIHKKVKNNVRP